MYMGAGVSRCEQGCVCVCGMFVLGVMERKGVESTG